MEIKFHCGNCGRRLSTRPLWWHLQAVKRVPLAPEVLVASTATASLFPRIRMFAKSLSKN
ncbi:MAG: hypothetical protein GXP32_03830 [Kiritimatiellaeota bacterium]|nr:hypothetical protein [Kiritimatiellota bacterium]